MTRNPPVLSALAPTGAGWSATLAIDDRREGARTVARHRHEGPLRVLKTLYPEGEGIAHHVLVHPPGGVVGGDSLRVEVDVGRDAHALVTTPGATRFYRSDGRHASQDVDVRLADGARFEWLPLETIVHAGAQAGNAVRVWSPSGASMIGWDVVCLGLPATAESAFDAGRLVQRLEVVGLWLDRATIEATDRRLLASPLGLAGYPVFATAWLVVDDDDRVAATRALEAARTLLGHLAPAASASAGAGIRAGVTQLHPRLVVARVLGAGVEPVMTCLRALRAAWRREAWALPAANSRVWGT